MSLIRIVPLLFLLSSTIAWAQTTMFTTQDFAQLKFLEGRWQGKGPDGSAFYEQYSFHGSYEMKSSRFADPSFATITDSSTVSLQDGKVISVWNQFSWQASELSAGKACFSPVNAPSSFCWEQISDTLVHVTQRWSDAQGKPQEYVVPLQRL